MLIKRCEKCIEIKVMLKNNICGLRFFLHFIVQAENFWTLLRNTTMEKRIYLSPINYTSQDTGKVSLKSYPKIVWIATASNFHTIIYCSVFKYARHVCHVIHLNIWQDNGSQTPLKRQENTLLYSYTTYVSLLLGVGHNSMALALNCMCQFIMKLLV